MCCQTRPGSRGVGLPVTAVCPPSPPSVPPALHYGALSDISNRYAQRIDAPTALNQEQCLMCFRGQSFSYYYAACLSCLLHNLRNVLGNGVLSCCFVALVRKWVSCWLCSFFSSQRCIRVYFVFARTTYNNAFPAPPRLTIATHASSKLGLICCCCSAITARTLCVHETCPFAVSCR